MAAWVRRTLGDLGFTQMRYVTAVRRAEAAGAVAEIYQQIDDEFGILAPPLTVHSAAPTILAAAWMMVREALVADGAVSRADKEAIAVGVSLGNDCPYCTSVHSSSLRALTANGGVTSTHVALRRWARGMSRRSTMVPAPFPADQAAEHLATAAAMHYLNRIVTVLLTELPLPPGAPRSASGVVGRRLGALVRSAAGRPHAAGTSLDLLPAAAWPPDLEWAAAVPATAEAFARSIAAVDAAAAFLPAPVQRRVLGWVSAWDGEPPAIGRQWLAETTGDLAEKHRAAARLVLAIAVAPYQAYGEVEAFRRDYPADRDLVVACAWAALIAARRITSWTWAALNSSPGFRD